MHEMEELKRRLCDELEKINDKGTMTASILDTVQKLTSAIKNIDTIIAMDEGYSNGMSYGSYARDRRGRNMDGSYLGYDDYRGSYDDSYRMRRDGGRDQRYSRERYSRDLKRDLEDLMHNADDKEKRMIEKWMRQLDD